MTTMTRMTRDALRGRAGLIGAIMLALCCGGCGSQGADYSKVDLNTATGKVTLDGQPLAGAVVTFEAEDGQFSYGLTDSNGAYALQFDSEKKGVTPGPKVVRISTTRKIPGLNTSEASEGGESSSEGGEAAKPTEAERVPERYNKNSELKVHVTGSQTFDFALESKP